MKFTKMDMATAVVSGLVCYGLVIGMPVWALYFGWTWFGLAGGGTQAFKKALAAMALGYSAGLVTAFVDNYTGHSIHKIVLLVGITVGIMTIMFKTKTFSAVPVAFGAYSCFFAGYYLNVLPPIAASELASTGDIVRIVLSIAWLALANFLGLVVGYCLEHLQKRLKEKNAD